MFLDRPAGVKPPRARAMASDLIPARLAYARLFQKVGPQIQVLTSQSMHWPLDTGIRNGSKSALLLLPSTDGVAGDAPLRLHHIPTTTPERRRSQGNKPTLQPHQLVPHLRKCYCSQQQFPIGLSLRQAQARLDIGGDRVVTAHSSARPWIGKQLPLRRQNA